jgi:hypothetical protein
MISWQNAIVGGNQRGGRAMAKTHYTYTALSGDTFDSIALDFYNHEHLSSHIIQENPEHRNTLTFKGGETLKIPIIEQQAAISLPPWKRSSK